MGPGRRGEGSHDSQWRGSRDSKPRHEYEREDRREHKRPRTSPHSSRPPPATSHTSRGDPRGDPRDPRDSREDSRHPASSYRSPSKESWPSARRPAPANPSPGRTSQSSHRRPDEASGSSALPPRSPASQQAASLPDPPPRPSNAPPRPGPSAALHTSSVLEELRKLAAARAALKKAEDEEAAPEPSERRRHSPIVWSKQREASGSPEEGLIPSSPRPTAAAADSSRGASGAGAMSATEAAARELASFQAASMDDDVDPDAPAAMRSSPSGSDESGGDQAGPSGSKPAANGVGGGPEAAPVPPGGVRSRWLAVEAEEAAAQAASRQLDEQVRQEAEELAALNAREAAELAAAPSAADLEAEEEAGEEAVPAPLVSMLQACRSVDCYQKLDRISEGTYGIVFRARDKRSGTIYALKKVKLDTRRDREGFPLTALREVNVLLSLLHPNVVDVSEVVVGPDPNAVYMVMEHMDHELKALMDAMPRPFSTAEVKNLLRQLLEGVAYLHHSWVIHRDLKTSNLLYNNRGELKICDFGLARQFGSPLHSYTHRVVTLYYRAPELLLGGPGMHYSTAVDVWSCGCIMAELLTGQVLFPGNGEFDAMNRIWKLLGTPNETVWPGYKTLGNADKINLEFPNQLPSRLHEKFPRSSGLLGPEVSGTLSDLGLDLLKQLLTLDPKKRVSAREALSHPWFDEHPKPKDQALMPTFPVKSRALGGATRKKASQASPEESALEKSAANIAALFKRPG